MLQVTVEYDHDSENPSDWGGWKFVSFNRQRGDYERQRDYVDRADNGEIVPVNIGIRRKLSCGTAFLVSAYEHSGIVYSLRGEGMRCRFDISDVAGIMLWQDKPKDLGPMADREKYARGFLESYNAWVNGEVYGYMITDENGADVDSCWGFIGDAEHVAENIRAVLAGREYELTGEAACAVSL